jgi:DNA-binding LacI/PurR family transcriptional regulator
MAEEAVRVVNSLLIGKETTAKKIVLPPELVVRDSCVSYRD